MTEIYIRHVNIYVLQETEMEIEDELDVLMSNDIMAAQMSTKSITFTRAQTGWIFREDRKVWQSLLILEECITSIFQG
jgi:hypothetical protein